MLGLAPHLAVPVEAEPFQIVQDRRLELALAAADVDVLDAHQEAAAGLARAMPAGPGRVGRAEMQLAGRAGGKARDDGHARDCLPSMKSRSRPGMPLTGDDGGSAARNST